jgi:hypothetical protein
MNMIFSIIRLFSAFDVSFVNVAERTMHPFVTELTLQYLRASCFPKTYISNYINAYILFCLPGR